MILYLYNMGETNLLNVFLISLKEKTDLQKPFKDSIKNLNLIQGVDARSNGFVYKIEQYKQKQNFEMEHCVT